MYIDIFVLELVCGGSLFINHLKNAIGGTYDLLTRTSLLSPPSHTETTMERYDCISCANTKFGRPYTIANDRVCGDCLVHIFDEAVEQEARFPPKWGDTELDPEKFPNVLNPRYMQRYTQRKEEWSIEARDRIYCNARGAAGTCGTFLGNRSAQLTLVRCTKCQAWTCRHCRELVASGRNANHHCDPNVERRERARAFEGLEKGKDYQKCPRCGQEWALHDGCNHMQCDDDACKAWFCYLCGVECDETYDHFSNRPGDGKCQVFPANGANQENGAPRPNHELMADLQGFFGPGGHIRPELLQRQEDLMRDFVGAGPARQFGQAPAPWRDQAPHAGLQNPFAALEGGAQNQGPDQEGGGGQALVLYQGNRQDQAADRRPVPPAGGAVPLDDRLADVLDRLEAAALRTSALLEFYHGGYEEQYLIQARILRAQVQEGRRLAQQSVEAQAEQLDGATRQYQHLADLAAQGSELLQVALSLPLWNRWIVGNMHDPRLKNISDVADAARPGGLFEQHPEIGEQHLPGELRGLLGQAYGAGHGPQAGFAPAQQPEGQFDQRNLFFQQAALNFGQ